MQQQKKQLHQAQVQMQQTIEKEIRTMSWLVAGQLIQVTLSNSEAAEDPADVESRESVEDGTMSETSNDAEVDTIVGRIYNYDYAVKLLTLKTVINPNTPDEQFTDTVLINSRNIKDVRLFPGSSLTDFKQKMGEDQLSHEFATGDQSRVQMTKIEQAMQAKMMERAKELKEKKKLLNL